MALEIYTLAVAYLDGALLTEESGITVDRDARMQEVNTVAKGFAGMSPGSPIVRIDLENGVPARDFELNPGKFFINPGDIQIVELTIFAASRSLTTKGFILKDNFRHAVNTEARLSFNFIGEPADWK